MSETRQLSRQELYELVWARPVTQIAEEFGLSDVALHKICKKHRVPVPARGYWAKFAAGKPVKQTAFRQIRDSYLDRILINRSPLKSLPPAVIKAGEGAKARIQGAAGRTAAGALDQRAGAPPTGASQTKSREGQAG